MKQCLQRYGHIMSADDYYTRWQEVSQWMAYNFDWFRLTLPPTILDFVTRHASTVFPGPFYLKEYYRIFGGLNHIGIFPIEAI